MFNVSMDPCALQISKKRNMRSLKKKSEIFPPLPHGVSFFSSHPTPVLNTNPSRGLHKFPPPPQPLSGDPTPSRSLPPFYPGEAPHAGRPGPGSFSNGSKIIAILKKSLRFGESLVECFVNVSTMLAIKIKCSGTIN